MWILSLSVSALLLVVIECTIDSQETPAVTLPFYTAIGKRVNVDGVEANLFLGLPYAKAPIQRLRFQKPERLEYDSREIQAVQFPASCPNQEDYSAIFPISEDCLFLNVFAPAHNVSAPKNPLPVLVFIHGGGFGYGSSAFYGANNFVRHFVAHDMLVVSIQYRLAMFGFAALPDSPIPANLGLWDQTMALAFLKEHIAVFHGDPNRITLMGHSAGAASAHALSLSPHSRNLFQGVIQISGSMGSTWAQNPDVVQFSQNVTSALGCVQGQPDFLNCMQSFPPSTLYPILKERHWMRRDLSIVHWTPILTDEFFDGKSLEQLTQEAPAKPVIYGFTSGEALIGTLDQPNPCTRMFASQFGVSVEKLAEFSRANAIALTNEVVVNEQHSLQPTGLYRRGAANVYFDDAHIAVGANGPFRQWTNLVSDAMFFTPFAKELQLKQARNWSQWTYVFDYLRPEDRARFGVPLTPHGYEFAFLTDSVPYFSGTPPLSLTEQNIVQTLTGAFVHFAKFGRPVHEEQQWPETTDAHTIVYLHVGETIEPNNKFFTGRTTFWKRLAAHATDSIDTGTNTLE